MFGTGGLKLADGFFFLGRPTGRFEVVGTCPRSLGKNDEARWLMALKTLAIYVTVSGKRVHSAQNVHSSYKRLPYLLDYTPPLFAS